MNYKIKKHTKIVYMLEDHVELHNGKFDGIPVDVNNPKLRTFRGKCDKDYTVDMSFVDDDMTAEVDEYVVFYHPADHIKRYVVQREDLEVEYNLQ